jgi:hypothetical protein
MWEFSTHGFKISPRKFETFLDYWTTFRSTNLECIPWWKWSPPRLSDNTYWFSYNLFYLFLVPSQYTKNKSSWVYLTWPYCKIHKLIVQIMKTIMLCKVPGISHCVHFVTLLENWTHTLLGLRKFLNYRHLTGHNDIYPHIVPNPNYGLILSKYWLVGFSFWPSY